MANNQDKASSNFEDKEKKILDWLVNETIENMHEQSLKEEMKEWSQGMVKPLSKKKKVKWITPLIGFVLLISILLLIINISFPSNKSNKRIEALPLENETNNSGNEKKTDSISTDIKKKDSIRFNENPIDRAFPRKKEKVPLKIKEKDFEAIAINVLVERTSINLLKGDTNQINTGMKLFNALVDLYEQQRYDTLLIMINSDNSLENRERYFRILEIKGLSLFHTKEYPKAASTFQNIFDTFPIQNVFKDRVEFNRALALLASGDIVVAKGILNAIILNGNHHYQEKASLVISEIN